MSLSNVGRPATGATMNPIGSEPHPPTEDAEAALAAALQSVTASFAHQQLTPNPELGRERAELDRAVATFRHDVLPRVAAVVAHLDATHRRHALEGIVSIAERLTGVLLSAGRRDE